MSRERVGIEGDGKYDLDDDGSFQFAVSGDLKVGGPATFRVYHVNTAISVDQWVVIHPCDSKNGRTYSLPAIGSEPISIVVLPRGDKRLKSIESPALKSVLQCLVEEAASEFHPVSAYRKVDVALQSYNRDAVKQPIYASKIDSPNHQPTRLVQSSYRSFVQSFATRDDTDQSTFSALADGVFIGRKAAELGLTPNELSELLRAWINASDTAYQKGLAALYERRYADAIHFITQSISSIGGDSIGKYVPLARAQYEQGDYSSAEQSLRKLVEVNPDPEVTNNLGVVLAAQEKYTEAEVLYERSIAAYSKSSGPQDGGPATVMNNLAALYSSQGKYADAVVLLKKALAVNQEVLGEEDPEVAMELNNLGAVYSFEGNFIDAEPLLQRALAINQKVLGRHDPAVATVLTNLGYIYESQGKENDAQSLYLRALEIDEQALGNDHPSVANDRSVLGNYYFSRRNYAKAEGYYTAVLTSNEKTFGPDHPSLSSDLRNLAVTYFSQHNYTAAEPLYKRALAIDEKALHPNDPIIAEDCNLIGALYYSQQRYLDADPFYERAIAINDATHSPQPDVLNNLASSYFKQKKYLDAEPLARRALSVAIHQLGPNNEDVAVYAEGLALVLRALGKNAEAEGYEEEAKRIRAHKEPE